jgi:hypothetical protein
MFVLVPILVDFLAASFYCQWLLHTVVAYLLADIALSEDINFSLGCSGLAFLLTDFAEHGQFGSGLLFLIPILLLLRHLKVVLVHGSTWLVGIGFFGFFLYERLLFPGGMTVWQILINLILGYLILLGLRGNRSPSSCAAGGRKVWTPNRKDAS